MIRKTVKYFTTHDSSQMHEQSFEFNSRYGTSKKIFDYLESNTNLLMIESIETEKAIEN